VGKGEPAHAYLFTGSRGTEDAWSNTAPGYGSYLLQWMNDGVMAADSNKNGVVTLHEMAVYLEKRGRNQMFWTGNEYVQMIPQVYPENSTFGLFM